MSKKFKLFSLSTCWAKDIMFTRWLLVDWVQLSSKQVLFFGVFSPIYILTWWAYMAALFISIGIFAPKLSRLSLYTYVQLKDWFSGSSHCFPQCGMFQCFHLYFIYNKLERFSVQLKVKDYSNAISKNPHFNDLFSKHSQKSSIMTIQRYFVCIKYKYHLGHPFFSSES